MCLQDFDASLKHIKRAQNLKPNNTEIIHLREELSKRKQKAKEVEKVTYSLMFRQKESSIVTANEPVTVPTPKKESQEDAKFEEELRKEIKSLMNNLNRRDITLPNNLTKVQMKIVHKIAEQENLQIQELKVRHQKVVKLAKLASQIDLAPKRS